MHYTIARDEGGMTVIPDTPDAREFLTLKYREMQKVGRKTKVVHLQDPMYSLTSAQGQAALFSHQGFWRSFQEYLEKNKHTVDMHDVRPKVLAEPNYAAAVIGMRAPQRAWILKALRNGNSGLLGAPTRYGKSYGMTALCRAFPKALTVIAAPGVDLCEQLFLHFKKLLPHREIKGVFSGSRNKKQSADITICSVDSLHHMDADATELLIVDEPHAVVSDGRAPKIARFTKARKYGFGATLKGRFDQKDRLIEGLIGPVIANVTYLEAVATKSISPLKVIMLTVPFNKDTIPGNDADRDIVYKRLLFESKRTASLIKKITHEVIPEDYQTMAFIQNERQAEFYMEFAMPSEGTIAMAKRLKPKERKALTAAIAAGEYMRVLASNIYVQGVTFSNLKTVINLAGGGANTTAIQKPGRLLEYLPGKNYGVMFDIMFKCSNSNDETRGNPPYAGIIRESWARYEAYKEIGYDIEFVETAERAREIVLGSYSY